MKKNLLQSFYVLKQSKLAHIILIMKLSVFFMFLMVFQLHAVNANSQEARINIQKNTLSLGELISEIEKQTEYLFVYTDNDIDLAQKVKLNAKNASVKQILTEVLKNNQLVYKFSNNYISLRHATAKQIEAVENTSAVSQQKVTVTGVVKDAQGLSIPGANIVVKGTTTGTITDIDGNFSLQIPVGSIVEVSYVGYVTKEVKVNSAKRLNLVLDEDAQALEAVVVVGYTTQKKADLTGAVSSVKVAGLNDLAVTGINNALQGRMSGVTVMPSSGAPGATTSVRIRGMGTFGNNEPLYVIDGMPAENMNDINPSDIERIDVLKDAASAAIYGSRAANGVVIIQTKKGKSGKVNVAFNTYHGVATPQKMLKLLTAKQRNMIHLEAYQNAIDDGSLSINPGSNDPRDYYYSDYAQQTRTNWQDEVFQNAYQGNYDLAISGGTDRIKYNIMGGHLTQDGIVKKSGFNRTTFRINTEIEVIKGLTVAENLMISHSNQKIVPDMGYFSGAITSALLFDPAVPVYAEGGGYSGVGELAADLRNPVAIVDRADHKKVRDRIFGNVYAQYNFLKDFTIKTDFGYDWSKWSDKEFNPKFLEPGGKSDTNQLTQRDWIGSRWMNTTTLKFDKKIKRHHVMALAGYSYEAYNMEFTNTRGSGFVSEDPSQRYMSAATNILWAQGGREEWALLSYFGRLDYSFADRYLLSVNFRSDGSSKFSKDNRWGYFPSVSAGWRISEEPFFEPAKKVVSNLKIRGSWGKLGNQNIYSNYPTKTIINNTTDDDGYNVVFGKGGSYVTAGRYEATMANPDLKWEVTTQTDLGLDVTFFGKLDLGLDYYNKESTDVLIQVPAPSLAGVTSDPWQNAAKVRNRGFDANIAYHTNVKGFDINAYGNISTVKNEVLALGNGSSAIFTSSYRGTNITRTTVGEPIAHFFGYKTDGIFRTQDAIDQYLNKDGEKIQPDAHLGDLKFVDVNDDGVIDDKDKTNLGNGFPDFTYGFGADLGYKGFDLNFFFQGVAGYDILNAMTFEGMFVDIRYNQFADIMDRYHPVNNPNGNLPRVIISDRDKNNNSKPSDYYISSGDYLRLKSLTLGYTFDKKLTRKIGLEKLRIYVTGQNLFTITKYKGYDPDLGDTSASETDHFGVTEVGVDRGQFPQARTFIVGANINF